MKKFYRKKGRLVASFVVSFSSSDRELLREVARYDGYRPKRLGVYLQRLVDGLLRDFAEDATFAAELNRRVVRRYLRQHRR